MVVPFLVPVPPKKRKKNRFLTTLNLDEKPPNVEANVCNLKKNPPSSEKSDENPDTKENEPEPKLKSAKTLFLPENWRQEICRCTECTKQFQELGIRYRRIEI